ncbi:MAG: haloacid dehalogenase-like hydrolase [Candidatus Bathyarchaeota archaeon]|nr:MAG: haloacid dehalogenase-like hydrolase [Candidatus Bathyarchaeota archaeon]
MVKNNLTQNNLILFDVEGVIIPKDDFLFRATIEHLDVLEVIYIIILGALYKIRILALERALRSIYRFFKGISLVKFYQTFREIPFIPYAYEVIRKLKKQGYIIALLSSGLPALFVEDLAKCLGADYAFGLELKTMDDYLTGEIGGVIMNTNGKSIIAKNLLKNLGSSYNRIVVADDRNNLPLISLCEKSIGFNPDPPFANNCSYFIKGDIAEILPYIEFDIKKSRLNNITKNELFREAIHVGSFLIPIICWDLRIKPYLIGLLIALITTIYISSEYARFKGIKIPIINIITSNAIIDEEKWGFASSPILFAVGIILPLIFYSVPEGYVVISVLTLGDGFASIFGMILGKTLLPFNKLKSLEGTLIGFLLAFLGTLIFIDPIKGLIVAIIGTVVEVIPSPINDNISIPIILGIVLILFL